LNVLDSGTQCFPLYYYEEVKENKPKQSTLFDLLEDEQNREKYARRDSISDFILQRAKDQYGGRISKEDIFYYVYGFLHSLEYKTMFSADLKKMLPRLPLVDDSKDFWAFSNAGRMLAELHLNYEELIPYKGVMTIVNAPTVEDSLSQLNKEELNYINYKVTKMKFADKTDKTKIVYNNRFTIENIPLRAYDYVVNGKSAIEWIMDRYQKTTHKDSGITNDPNDWAVETGNPKYIFDLLHSVINLSVQTMEIVKKLPSTKIGDIMNKDEINLKHVNILSLEEFEEQAGFAARGELDKETIKSMYEAYYEKAIKRNEQKKNRKISK
jgi:predicted helicase